MGCGPTHKRIPRGGINQGRPTWEEKEYTVIHRTLQIFVLVDMKSCQPLVTPLRTAGPNQPCGRIRTIRGIAARAAPEEKLGRSPSKCYHNSHELIEHCGACSCVAATRKCTSIIIASENVSFYPIQFLSMTELSAKSHSDLLETGFARQR